MRKSNTIIGKNHILIKKSNPLTSASSTNNPSDTCTSNVTTALPSESMTLSVCSLSIFVPAGM